MPVDLRIQQALRGLPVKPADSASQSAKKKYSEDMSAALALAFAAELRDRGLTGTRPESSANRATSGAERRISGGIGAKRVDVSSATDDSGLLFGMSIKTINFRDKRSNNFQKNLTNRRGDMLFEAVTLHRRFPYAVLCGLLILDAAAAVDGTDRRQSTFMNAHKRLRLFTGRDDPAGRDEQYEKFYIALAASSDESIRFDCYPVGDPEAPVEPSVIVNELLQTIADRNPDFYEFDGEKLSRLGT